MAMLTMERVMRELEGKDERGKRSLLSKRDLLQVKARFHDYAFAYSKKDGGKTMCSGCGGELTRTAERHKDYIRCPQCKKDVQVWEEWRGHKYLYEQVMVYIWVRSKTDPETILAKAIRADKFMGGEFPEIAPLAASVEALYQFGPKGAKKYTRGYWSGSFSPNDRSVTPEENKHSANCEAFHVGFWPAAEGTQLGFTADAVGVKLVDGNYCSGMHPVCALTEAARKPYLRHMIYQGQTTLARQITQGCYKVKKRTAKDMPALLGLTEGQWYEARQNRMELTADWLQALEDIQSAGSMTITLRDAWAAVENNSSYARHRLSREAPELLARCTPKLRRKAVRRAAYSRDLPEWLDYWDQLRTLGEDMTDARLLLPKDMHEMHRRMTERINAIADQKKREMNAIMRQESAKRMKALKERYSFEACGLILRPFESEEEVIAEGTAQHICIGGYAKRYMEGGTILCALRRAECPEEPWRAIEFSATTGKLVQDRGAYNDRGLGERNLQNGVAGWLKRFWAAFDARQNKTNKHGRNAA